MKTISIFEQCRWENNKRNIQLKISYWKMINNVVTHMADQIREEEDRRILAWLHNHVKVVKS